MNNKHITTLGCYSIWVLLTRSLEVRFLSKLPKVVRNQSALGIKKFGGDQGWLAF